VEWTFFADRDIQGKEFKRIVRAAGIRLEVHSDHFVDYEDDAVWLPAVASRGWVVLSGDRRIKSRPQNIQAVMNSGSRVLTLVRKDTRNHLIATNFVNTLPKVLHLLDVEPAPFVATIGRANPPEEAIAKGIPGPVKVVVSHAQWLASCAKAEVKKRSGE
jgi:hypothetical protein